MTRIDPASRSPLDESYTPAPAKKAGRFFIVFNHIITEGHAKRMKPSAFAVWICLLEHADRSTLISFPSQTTIADLTGMSTRNVRSMIKSLVEQGYLEIKRYGRPKYDGNGGENAIYRVIIPEPQSQAEPEEIISAGPENISVPPEKFDNNVRKLLPQNNTNTNKTHRNKSEGVRQSGEGAGELVEIPMELDTQEFTEAWEAWQDDRKARGNPLTPRAARIQLKNLVKFGATWAIRRIEKAIERGWLGLIFEEDELLSPATTQAAVQDAITIPGPDGFERVWKAYPQTQSRRTDRQQCLAIWARGSLENIVEKIVEALETQKRSDQWIRDEGRYVPKITNWLSQRQWESITSSPHASPVPAKLEIWS